MLLLKTQTLKCWKKPQTNLHSHSETNTHSHIHQCTVVPSHFQQGVWNIKRQFLYAFRAEDRKQHPPWAPGETQQPPTDPAAPTYTLHTHTSAHICAQCYTTSMHTHMHIQGIAVAELRHTYRISQNWDKKLQLPFIFCYSVAVIRFHRFQMPHLEPSEINPPNWNHNFLYLVKRVNKTIIYKHFLYIFWKQISATIQKFEGNNNNNTFI